MNGEFHAFFYIETPVVFVSFSELRTALKPHTLRTLICACCDPQISEKYTPNLFSRQCESVIDLTAKWLVLNVSLFRHDPLGGGPEEGLGQDTLEGL